LPGRANWLTKGGDDLDDLLLLPPWGEDDRHLEHYKNGYAVTAVNELLHYARNSGVYTNAQLGYAAFQLLDPDEQLKRRLPKSNDVDANSKYFHSLFNLHCRSTTGE
jgi:hypothetical protein